MAASTIVSLLLATLIPAFRAVATTNPPIAYWTDPSAAVIRDAIYISGGDRYTNTTTGPYPGPQEFTPAFPIYNISLCDAFSTAENNLDFLLEQQYASTATDVPWYIGGAMFASDSSFYTYGGMKNSAGSNDSGVTYGHLFQDTPSMETWRWGFRPGWDAANLTDGARELTQGSYASAPSENLAFWFGGLRALNNGPVVYGAGDGEPDQANTPALDFIMFDLNEDLATSRNMTGTLPSGVEPRAEGAMVWLPYGNQGMLLAFGGIAIPADMTVSGLNPIYNSNNDTDNKIFMDSILVYDIDSQQWVAQQIDRNGGNPGPLASFCTVVAAPHDNSSYHIYVYGGYDGTYSTDSSAYDTVWVLSIPAFRWTQVSGGVGSHRRQNHVCTMMNANTMLSIGGNMESGLPLLSPAFDVFDLSSGVWTSSYTPNASAVYTVPATITSNVPDMTTIPSNLEPNVTKWLNLRYTGHISGPRLDSCPPKAPTSSPTSSPTPVKKSIVGPAVGGAVGGAAVIAGLVLLFCCFRRRRRGNRSMDTNRNSIFSWMDRSTGHHSAPKSMPDSENTVIASPGVEYFGIKGHQVEAYEMPSNVPSPGYNHSYSHGSPQIVPGGSATSPFLGSVEVDAQSRHEIMDHQPRAGSSFGPNPYSMHSVSGRHNPMSVRSDSVSHASEAVMHSRHYGYVSPYELAHDRSNENLATPPTDLALGEPQKEQRNASTHSLGVGAEKVNSPTVMTPIAPITRTIDSVGTVEQTDTERPHHKRNQSSISSNLPNLPSPGPEEDRRRSRLLENLPDRGSTGTSSPIQPQTAKKSAYTEDLDA